MTDFIIVGSGLSASVLMHRFFERKIKFVTVGHPTLSACSRIAGGIWNPIVFKRMTKSWMADELVHELNVFYKSCELRLNTKFVHQRKIAKPFFEEQEIKLWQKKSKNELASFLNPEPMASNTSELMNCKTGELHGEVIGAGFIDMPSYLDLTAHFFNEFLTQGAFDYTALEINRDFVTYKSIKAKNIIFCEGYLVKNNPWFNWIPLNPAKGEVFTICCNTLQLKQTIYNKNGFIVGKGDEIFKVGATYSWGDLDENPSTAGKLELEDKLSQLISCPYTLLSHDAGIRPASKDRRPIIGRHPFHENLFVFNGMGTKGVMLAPYFSENFVNFYIQNAGLNMQVNVARFYHLYEESQKQKKA